MNDVGSKLSSPFPSVIGIGSRRCASSTVHDWLNQHPEVRKPKRGLHFFSEHYSNGLDWYQKQLSECSGNGILIESSVSYTYPEFYKASIERILNLNSETKFFITVRNPIERAFSDYLRSLRQCEIPKKITFKQAIEQYPVFLERGLYGKVLSSILQRTSKSNIKVLFYDDLVESPQAFREELFSFLNINPEFSPQDATRRNQGRVAPRFASLNKKIFLAKNGVDRIASSLGCFTTWEKLKRFGHKAYERCLAMNTSLVEFPKDLTPKLNAYYAADICSLEAITERSLTCWKQVA